jgi:hypothetical protein
VLPLAGVIGHAVLSAACPRCIGRRKGGRTQCRWTLPLDCEARDYVGKIDNKIALIDGQKLAELMIDHNLGVSPMATYEVKRVDADYGESPEYCRAASL